MTLSLTNSRWSSLVFFFVFLHLSHAYLFPLSKKLHLDYFSSLFIQHSLHQIPCKSLWDLNCLVSWGDKCFLCDELGHTGLLLSVQLNPFGATKAHNSVPPISLQKRQLAICSCIPFAPAPLNDSYPLPAPYFSLLLCHVTQGPNLFWLTLQKTPSWKLMSKGERELKSKLNHIKRGKER